MRTIKRYFTPPMKSYFLFGPRGSGKSTWVKLHYPQHAIIDLLEPDKYRNYNAYPERLTEYVKAHAHNTNIFIIDEVQKIPELLSVVHKLIETNKNWQFILTGSSSRKLKQAGVDLLAARAQLCFMNPFMASEIGNQFNLEKHLKLGLLPLILESPDPKNDLNTYIALYMKEEVHAEGLVRRLSEFSRFIESISFSQASSINCSNIARDCGVSSATIESYITILEDLLLALRLPAFTKRAKRDLSSHQKFYYFDTGVYQSIRPRGPLDNANEIDGHALETLVMQNLKAWLDYSKTDGTLYFWRTRKGTEVDFIIYGEIGFFAIEVKNSTRIQPKELRGLQEFKKDYPSAQCIFIYRGSEKLQKNEILCIPAEEFLKNLIPNKPISTN